jgi:TRAP-type uncharacterized transport system substrate-binding protein
MSSTYKSARNGLICLCFFLLTPFHFASAEQASVGYEEKKRETNDIAVIVVVSGLSCTCARFAEDIRNVVNEIATYDDLRGKKVNFNLKSSQTEVSADVIFEALKIDVQKTNYDNDEAIQKLKDGEIAAMIVLSGAPQAALAKMRKEDQVHFLALDKESLPNHDLNAISSYYLPAELTQYPNLIDEGTSVATVANRALLVAYAWPDDSDRYKKLTKFVQAFFGKIDQFRNAARHPKWSEINLSAEIPGWTRFKLAADWLAARLTGRFLQPMHW